MLPVDDAAGPGTAAVRAVASQPIAIVAAIGFVLGAVMYLAWFLPGRRRRAEDRRELSLELAKFGAVAAERGRAGRTTHGPDDEDSLPRWLRPSVREGRTWTPSAGPRRTIGSERAPRIEEPTAGSGAAFVAVRTDVALLNVPNETLSTRITSIASGDDVEVLQVKDHWARVRTPMGDEGWIPAEAIGR